MRLPCLGSQPSLTNPRPSFRIEHVCDNNEQRRSRSLADIVREKTNDGDTIVQFYLDVANGKLDDEGFEACHRRDAAMQIHAIAPELVAEAIARLAGVQCGHAERRTKSPIRRSREDGNPSPDANRANAARRHEALEYLASALAAPSLADDPRVAGIVRESTDQGKTVVSFLLHVMHGVVRGFRTNNRMEAAKELIGHIARDELRADGLLPAEPALSAVEGSFPRRACPVLDTGREPTPGPAAVGPSFPSSREPIPGLDHAEGGPGETTVIPAESLPRTRYGAGIQGGRDGEGLPSDFPEADDRDAPALAEADLTVIPAESLPRTRYGAGIQGGGDGEGLPSDFPEADDPEAPDPKPGCYDIDRKIAVAQRDPSHPIHKFVQAYDEVAAAFHGEDNDDDEEVRYWISGEVPDAYGKYIWEYAPAYPRSIRRRLRPRRRRRSTPKAESVWDEAAHRQDARGRRPAAQTHTNLGLNPPRRPTGPSGANDLRT